jgi:hypothetical protein
MNQMVVFPFHIHSAFPWTFLVACFIAKFKADGDKEPHYFLLLLSRPVA